MSHHRWVAVRKATGSNNTPPPSKSAATGDSNLHAARRCSCTSSRFAQRCTTARLLLLDCKQRAPRLLLTFGGVGAGAVSMHCSHLAFSPSTSVRPHRRLHCCCMPSVRFESTGWPFVIARRNPWWHRGDSVRFGIETLRSRVTAAASSCSHPAGKRTLGGEQWCFETTTQRQDVSQLPSLHTLPVAKSRNRVLVNGKISLSIGRIG